MMNYYSGRQEVDSGHGGMFCEDIDNVGAKQRTLSPYSCPLPAVGQRPLYRIVRENDFRGGRLMIGVASGDIVSLECRTTVDSSVW
jgi:hypothetical protein